MVTETPVVEDVVDRMFKIKLKDALDAIETGEVDMLADIFTKWPLIEQTILLGEAVKGCETVKDFEENFGLLSLKHFAKDELIIELIRQSCVLENEETEDQRLLKKHLSMVISQTLEFYPTNLDKLRSLLEKRISEFKAIDLFYSERYIHPYNILNKHSNCGCLTISDDLLKDLFKCSIITPGLVIKTLVNFGIENPSSVRVITLLLKNHLRFPAEHSNALFPEGMLPFVIMEKIVFPPFTFPVTFYRELHTHMPDLVNLDNMLFGWAEVIIDRMQCPAVIDFLLAVCHLENAKLKWTKMSQDVPMLIRFFIRLLNSTCLNARKKEQLLEVIDFSMKKIERKINKEDLLEIRKQFKNDDEGLRPNIILISYFQPYCPVSLLSLIEKTTALSVIELLIIVSVLPIREQDEIEKRFFTGIPKFGLSFEPSKLRGIVRFSTAQEFSNLYSFLCRFFSKDKTLVQLLKTVRVLATSIADEDRDPVDWSYVVSCIDKVVRENYINVEKEKPQIKRKDSGSDGMLEFSSGDSQSSSGSPNEDFCPPCHITVPNMLLSLANAIKTRDMDAYRVARQLCADFFQWCPKMAQFIRGDVSGDLREIYEEYLGD